MTLTLRTTRSLSSARSIISEAARYLPVALLVLWAPMAHSATIVTFSDNFGPPSTLANWTSTAISGSGTVTQPATGGNVDGYQQTAFSSAGEETSVMISATYNPSVQGKILDITIGFDYIGGTAGSQFFPLIMQNGNRYRSVGAVLGTASWLTFSTGTMVNSGGSIPNFCLDAGCSSSPNFTDPMQFGYITLQQSGAANLGVDNFSVVIDTVPEPASWALFAGGIALVASCRFSIRRSTRGGLSSTMGAYRH